MKELLEIIKIAGMFTMLLAFVVLPDDNPWYHEMILFNAGLWSWLGAKYYLRKINPTES